MKMTTPVLKNNFALVLLSCLLLNFFVLFSFVFFSPPLHFSTEYRCQFFS